MPKIPDWSSDKPSYFKSKIEMIARLLGWLPGHEAYNSLILGKSNNMLADLTLSLGQVKGVGFENQLFVSIIQCQIYQASACILLRLTLIQHAHVAYRLPFNRLDDICLYLVLQICHKTIRQPKVEDGPPIGLKNFLQLQRLLKTSWSEHDLLHLFLRRKLYNLVYSLKVEAISTIRV